MTRQARRSNGTLSRLIKRIQRVHEYADKTGMPIDEVYAYAKEQEALANKRKRARRDFLKTMGAGALAGSVLSSGTAMARAVKEGTTSPGRVVIIGGGLAGLRCADKLWRFGYTSKIYEASPRVGGRVLSDNSFFDQASHVNRGGEFISSEHKAIRRLCRRLGLELEDVNGGASFDGEELYYSKGQLVSEAQLNDVWGGIRRTFRRTERAAPFQPFYNDFNDEHFRLDNINVPDWLDEIGIGANSPVGGIFQADVISEYGLPPEDQPSLNLLYLLAYNPRETALPLAGTDEQFTIVGGSEALATALADRLPVGTIECDKELIAIRGDAQGPYECHFSDGSCHVADQLVLTLPFTKLRHVDIDDAIWESFIPEKREAINRLAMGSNAKLHIETSTRPWQQTRVVDGEAILTNGVSYSDEEGYVTVWDTQSTSDSGGTVYVDYLGGHQGLDMPANVPFARAKRRAVRPFLREIENVFPGTKDAYTGKALSSKWAIHPWSLGSYSTPALGDYTSIWGAQREKEAGNKVFFAGEHVSEEGWGFMDGAIETGTLVAKQLVMFS